MTVLLPIPTPGGVLQIRAEVHRPAAPAEPSFVLTHGAGGDLCTPGLKAMAEGIAGRGHLVVRVDLPYRAAGRASAPLAARSVPGFIESVRQVVERFGPDSAWVVGGRSYGGRVASMAAAEGLAAAGLLFYSYPLHRPGDSSAPRVEHWPDIAVPCLFLEGTNDPFCDLDLLRVHLPRLGGPATLHVVEGGDHSLKVTGAGAPDGKARSEKVVAAGLASVIEPWAETLN